MLLANICSIAIMMYLAEKFGTPEHWYPSDLQKRARERVLVLATHGHPNARLQDILVEGEGIISQFCLSENKIKCFNDVVLLWDVLLLCVRSAATWKSEISGVFYISN